MILLFFTKGNSHSSECFNRNPICDILSCSLGFITIISAGDCDVLILDKTGTITEGSRSAIKFIPLEKYSEIDVGQAALQLQSMTPLMRENQLWIWLKKVNSYHQ